MTEHEVQPVEGEVAVSVVRDGADSWVCIVEWPDGTQLTREQTFHFAGLPAITITDEHRALNILASWVETRPEDWRRP